MRKTNPESIVCPKPWKSVQLSAPALE